ncbi:SMP-30/gluconolactonase/LRE family protein [Sunxiuqinia sp. sy24]|uniref:SMP-30/gluconolactonase/LRE family protein n=1 Tax=Sunxiuqinia sp. sy24 TaxID=3461495 RepID=UPI004045FF28
MKTIIRIRLLLLISLISALSTLAQPVKSLTQLANKKADLEQIASGFSFTEGPAVNSKGEVYFTDQPNNKIYLWNEKDEIKVFPVDGERANGLYFDQDGLLLACADYRNKLISIDQQGNKTVLADNFEGKHLNGPNDLWIHPSGAIYITDSYYHRPWWPEGQLQVQNERAVYCVHPDSQITRVAAAYKMPNGIIGTPDGKTLYVADIQDEKIWQYTILEDGSLGNKTFFAPEGSDGMTIDKQGNVYLTNKAVSVYSSQGAKLRVIEVPERPSNVCFGGKKRKTLFITARTSIYKLAMTVKGVK